MVKLFDYFGLKKNHLKIIIPDWVFRLPNQHKLAFINGYIDADGHLTKNGETKHQR